MSRTIKISVLGGGGITTVPQSTVTVNMLTRMKMSVLRSLVRQEHQQERESHIAG